MYYGKQVGTAVLQSFNPTCSFSPASLSGLSSATLKHKHYLLDVSREVSNRCMENPYLGVWFLLPFYNKNTIYDRSKGFFSFFEILL